MGQESYQLGIEGEERASQFLLQHGYQILEKNFRSQQGEIDLVTKEKDTLVFVEVKNYSFRSYGSAIGAVKKSKRESIIHAARTYLFRNKIKDTLCRFDVVTINREQNGGFKIELYKNAFVTK